MNGLFAAVRHNIGGLLRFTGRDTPAQFWPYAGFVAVLLFVLTTVVMLPPMASVVAHMHRFAIEHPDQADVSAEAATYSWSVERTAESTPNVQGIIQPMIFLAALSVALLGAAVVRRLHDRGRSGLWAAPPVAFLLIGLVLTPRLFRNFASSPTPDLTLFFLLLANNLLYLLSLLLLIFLLARSGTPGPNRFGPDPRGVSKSPAP